MDNKEVLNTEWFKALIDECQSILVEYTFTSRWAIIEGYHALGKRITEENGNFEREKIYGKGIVNACANSLGKSARVVYYAIQFYQKYPDLSLFPVGKNISWNDIRTKYLPKPEPDDIEKPEENDAKTVSQDSALAIESSKNISIPPQPIITFEWNQRTELWEATIAEDSFIILDVALLKDKIEWYLKHLI